MEFTLIFPNQLFRQHQALKKGRPVYLVEESLFFTELSFHQQKLVLHRASMRAYAHSLGKKGYEVVYIESGEEQSDVRVLLSKLPKGSELFIAEVDDDWLQQRIEASAHAIQWYRSPGFLNTVEEGRNFFSGRSYFQTDFYKAQRKQRGLLMEGNKPMGGSWTYDSDNRQRLPKEISIPQLPLTKENAWVKEARQYVRKHFSQHYGTTETPFDENGFYPVTHEEAKQWLHHFLEQRFAQFGPYEDAQSGRHPVLFHSLLSPLLNTGLLQPQEVLDAALDFAGNHDVPLPSLEGFVRQLVGWREYIRLLYHLEGRRQRTQNFWGFERKIPLAFWEGCTGIAPVDHVIKKLLRSGYCHHIERLMVLGNFFLLCEFHPDEVYRWFMELFIDSYDWVMVPNVYAMTQFADGGKMMTKPYISGSNYLMKMGDWPKGEWQEVWDGLFWRFLHRHRDYFLKNPRLAMLVRSFDKMEAGKRTAHLQHAENFLQSLDEGKTWKPMNRLFN